MGFKRLFWIIVFVLSSFSAFATSVVLDGLNTTFGGLSNPSTNASAWFNQTNGKICAGYFPTDPTKLCANMSNQSILYNVSTGNYNGVIEKSEREINITSSTVASTQAQLMSGALAPFLENGMCMDIQFIAYASPTTDVSILFGFKGGTDLYSAASVDHILVGYLRNQNPVNKVIMNSDGNVFTAGAYTASIDVVHNLTICANQTNNNAIFYLNNSNNSENTVGGTHLAKTNFTFLVHSDTGPGASQKYGIRWIAVYNQSLGAPQASQSAPDTTSPFVASQSLNTTSPRLNYIAQWGVNCTDETAIGSVYFETNRTGSFVNVSSITGLNQQSVNFTANITINVSRGNVVAGRFTCNDTSSNTFQSNLTTLTVANTPPNATSIFNATELNVANNLTLNATLLRDADGDNINYIFLFEASSNPPSVVRQNTSATSFTTNMTNESVYFARVDTTDGFDTTQGTLVWNGTLDTSIPVLTNCNIANGTRTRLNRTVTCTCDDANLFEFNVTSYLVTNNSIFFSNTTLNLTPTYTSYTSAIFVNTTWGEGNYNISFWCGDTKNRAKKMPVSVKMGKEKSDKNRNKFNVYQINDSSNGLQINMTVLINKTKLEHPKDSQNLEVNFTLVDDDFFKMTIAYDTSENNQTTFINFTSNQKIIHVFDEHFTHLLFGSGKERISYDSDDASSNFNFAIKMDANSAFVSIIPKNEINKGERLVIDPKADNLNSIQSDSEIIIDLTKPSFSNRFPANDSELTSSSVQINITINDTSPLTAVLRGNFSGTFASNVSSNYTSLTNVSFNLTLDSGVYIYSIFANDTAGNENTTQNFTFLVNADVTAPNVTLITPLNNTIITKVSISEITSFTFRVSETSDCALYYDNSLRRNTSVTAEGIYNVTVTGFGIGTWLVNCTDSAGNRNQSQVFFLDVRQAQLTGGGAPPSTPSGSGGGLPTSQLESIPQYTYTIEYICSRVKEFIENHTKEGIYNSYPSQDLTDLQIRITRELGYSISERTIREYIDYSESYCKIEKGKKKITSPIIPRIEFLSITNDENITWNDDILNFTLQSYIPLFGQGINIGSIQYYKENNAKGFVDFLNLLFKVKTSDNYGTNPNFILAGPRVISSAVLGIGAYISIRRYRKKRIAEKVI